MLWGADGLGLGFLQGGSWCVAFVRNLLGQLVFGLVVGL